ncbi:ABC transporter permease [Lederbergia graminis]|uniref:ABC transporter permease n=1 Tax=Lederbergia graminis TaxID=735518 RepID=A0ABW0LES8_9BACI|nr:ABC transporter permease [Paenibacillus bovis]HLU22092.1 ABC transporter permease [Bacillaceae bacterium]
MGANIVETIKFTFVKMQRRPSYKYILMILGLPVYIFAFIYFLIKKKNDAYFRIVENTRADLINSGYKENLQQELKEQLLRKHEFFNEKVSEQELSKQVDKLTTEKFEKAVLEKTQEQLEIQGVKKVTFIESFQSLLSNPLFLILSFIPGLLMYVLIFLYSNPFVKYVFERLLMTIFVIFGVVVLVFTILYLSPFDPAANILGETATREQIANFNRIYGLDLPYLTQLWNAVTGIATFDLGNSYAGNENVAVSIANKFPITFTITMFSLLMAIAIAIPVGIVSAMKPNSFMDYTFMFIALLGLSIPNFWQGLIFILNFSIKLQWLPATFNPDNWVSMIMPVVVLGTGLTASVARMTRSSMLEVINEDYIITAKAKGLNKSQVLWKHAVGNAMIPIITVIGLLFGGMLGGAAVTEKVFNISGIGSYIVDKQFIPDIPAILAGVVYVAVTISLVNVIIDILYAFFDPRIRSKMKHY